MKLVAKNKSEQNQAVLDPWTLVHGGFGVAAGMMGVSLPMAIGLAIGYEVVEQVLQRTRVGQDFFMISGPEIPMNAVADVAVYLVGWHYADRWSKQSVIFP